MTTRKPKRHPGEPLDDYHERIAAWQTMTRIGTELKTVRSRAADALQTVECIQAITGGPWYRREIPDSQKERVSQWRDALAEALALLDRVDVDAWKPEVVAESVVHQ